MSNPSAKGLKVYVPARDFELSKLFYSKLGFEVSDAWGGNVDCSIGDSVFRLQNYFVEDWAGNFMMQFDTEDVSAWYERASSVIGTGAFGPARAIAPRPEGSDTVVQIVDPSGVLLTFIQHG